jgi:hypothetical protein
MPNILALLLFLASTFAWANFVPALRPLDVQTYRIKMELDPSEDPAQFEAEVSIRFKATEALQEVTLDAEELAIHKVTWQSSSKALEVTTTPKTLTIQLPQRLKKGQTGNLKIAYSGKINDTQQGFFKVHDPDDAARGPLFFTHFEPLGARSFFPCNDEPYDKATTEVQVSVPVQYDVISNGKKTMDRKFRKESLQWHEVHWAQEKPHSTYLVTLTVGPFTKVTAPGKGIEYSFYVGEKSKERAEYGAKMTKSVGAFFEKYLGVNYPWAKYATLGMPTFLWGGMENTTATNMNESNILLNDPNSAFEKKRIVGLASHELAHQWFGDYVTMKWWNDVWLNESFASFMATEAEKFVFDNPGGEVGLSVDTWNSYFREEDGPRSHPIVDNELSSADDAFDSTNYTKGENVLRMLRDYVGEDKFRKGLKQYLNRYGLKNATYEDLFTSMESVSGEDLKSFRDTWLLQKGYPVVTYSGTWDATTSKYQLKIAQASNHGAGQGLFTFRLPVVFHRKSAPAYSKEIVMDVSKDTETQTVDLLASPDWISVNPRGVVLAKVKQATPDEGALALQALEDPEPMGRVWASYQLVGGLLVGDSISIASEKTLVHVLQEDQSPYVRLALLSWFGRLKDRWLPSRLADAVLKTCESSLVSSFAESPLYLSDPLGWSAFRSSVLGSLGAVQDKSVFPLLTKVLANPALPLDDLSSAAHAAAMQGTDKSAELLKTTLKLHEDRGYPYKFQVLMAFGALESPKAASEIRTIASTSGSDVMGRIGWPIQDNQVLKNSPEWAAFLKDFVLTDNRFGDEIKVRILHTVEEVKTSAVQRMLEALVKDSTSDRIKEFSKKVLQKNFSKV